MMTEQAIVGWWYATGPEDREFCPTDPAVAIYRVSKATSTIPGCALVKGPDGREFPLEYRILQEIAQPPSEFPIA
jgi:hypothetical protein